MRARSQRGFTLIEMMIVVAIIGILAGLLISASSRPVGASARNTSEQLVSTLSFARLRANTTRLIHTVKIEDHRISVWVLDGTPPPYGLAMPATPTWRLVQSSVLPNGVSVWDVASTAVTATGATITQNPALSSGGIDITIRPDGQASASTVYITDNVHHWRVLVYHITGGAYARESW